MSCKPTNGTLEDSQLSLEENTKCIIIRTCCNYTVISHTLFLFSAPSSSLENSFHFVKTIVDKIPFYIMLLCLLDFVPCGCGEGCNQVYEGGGL